MYGSERCAFQFIHSISAKGQIMNYTINLGCWGSVFAVPTDVVDKYLKIAGSAQLKVLLYILRSSGSAFSESDIAAALNMDTYDVKDCIEFWSSFGVIAVNDGEITPKQGQPEAARAERKKPAQPETVPEPKTAKQRDEKPALEPAKDKPSDTVVARPLRPDPIYVAKRVSEDKEIESLLNEAQYILGRPLSGNDNGVLIMLHDNDALPCEVILMLLTYCVENHKGMNHVAMLGASWAKEGILTIEQADEKIRRLEERKEAYRKVQTILGLEFRKASKTEEELYDRWINEWKLGSELIKEAYDVCVDAKGKFIPKYVATILQNWHDEGVRTVDEARARSRKKNSGTDSGSDGHSSFDVNDLSGLGLLSE